MTLYSFKGHYPVEQIDTNKGWYEVPAKPEAPEGKEVVWLNAEWVVRDPKPEDCPGFQWNWNHGEMAWVKCKYDATALDGWVWVEIIDSDTGKPMSSDWQVIEKPKDGKEYVWHKSKNYWAECKPPYPNDGKAYLWDDVAYAWVAPEVEG